MILVNVNSDSGMLNTVCGKEGQSVQVEPEWACTLVRKWCSRWTGIGVHDRPEYASMGMMFTFIWRFRHIWRFSLRYLHRPWDRGINDQVSHRALIDETFRACNCCLNKPLSIRMGINGSITSVEASPSATIVDVRIPPHNGWLDRLLGCKGRLRLLPHQVNWWRFRGRVGAGWPSQVRLMEDASLQHVE